MHFQFLFCPPFSPFQLKTKQWIVRFYTIKPNINGLCSFSSIVLVMGKLPIRFMFILSNNLFRIGSRKIICLCPTTSNILIPRLRFKGYYHPQQRKGFSSGHSKYLKIVLFNMRKRRWIIYWRCSILSQEKQQLFHISKMTILLNNQLEINI